MTPNDTEKGREWWVPSEVLDPHFGSALPLEPPLIHVIEKSYFDELLAKYNFMVDSAQQNARERDEVIRRYQSIELANSVMSRNDHVHFGDLMQERDEARAEVERNQDDVLACAAHWMKKLERATEKLTEQSALLDMAVVALESSLKTKREIYHLGLCANGMKSMLEQSIEFAKDALAKITAARKE